MSCCCRPLDIVIGSAICNQNHEFSLIRLGFAEELLKCIIDGCSRAGPSAPVVDSLDCIQDILLRAELIKAEFQPLLIGILDSSDSSVCVGNLKFFANVGYELEDSAEVSRANTAGSINDKSKVC